MKIKLWLTSLLAIVLVLVSVWALAQEPAKKTSPQTKSQSVTEQNHQSDSSQTPAATAAGLVLYYGDGCPHCKIVEDYLSKEPKSQSLKLVSKEVYNNSTNQEELIERAKVCGITAGSVGIPLLWDGENSRCLVGDQDIIAELKTRLK